MGETRRVQAVAIGILMVTSFLVSPHLARSTSAASVTTACDPGEVILDRARSEGKTIVHWNVSVISGTSITIPADEVWVAHDNLTLEADLTAEIKGSLVGAQPDNASAWGTSLEVDASTLSLTGNLSAGSGADASTQNEYTQNVSGVQTRFYEGVNGTSGGELILDVTTLSADPDACLATGDGGNGTDVITWETDVSAANESRIEHRAGNGDRGGKLLTYEDLEDDVNETRLFVGNGGTGGKVVTNHSFAPSVGNQTIVGISGAGGLSGIPYTYDRSSTDLDLEGPDLYTTQSTKLGGPTVNDGDALDTENATYLEHLSKSGDGGHGGDVLIPLGTNYTDSPGLCERFPEVCTETGAPDPPDSGCAPDGHPGADGADGVDVDPDGEDGQDAPDREEGGGPQDADDAEASGTRGPGGGGLSDGGDGGDKDVDADCGGDAMRGGWGGNATEAGYDGGFGGAGGNGGFGGDVTAHGGDGGDANILGFDISRGDGGNGGTARAWAGDGGDGGHGHCTDGEGGNGNIGGIGGFGGAAEAYGGAGGRGWNGGDGGDAGADGRNGGPHGNGGDGGDGDIAGDGGMRTDNDKNHGGTADAVSGEGAPGTDSNGSDGGILWEDPGDTGADGASGDAGESCS